MGISKTEVNLRRLLAASPQQQNQAKLVHYVATLREQLEQLAEERTTEGLPRISKAMLNDYSEKIETIASKLVNNVPDIQESEKDNERDFVKENPSEIEDKKQIPLSSGLRRRPVPASSTEDRTHELAETDHSSPVKLDAAAHAHIEKHRKLQDDLTDEMVVLAKQLKESSLMMSQSLQNTEKILDSTEKAIEHSLASTGRANVRATAIYSESSKTSCLTWLLMFVMTEHSVSFGVSKRRLIQSDNSTSLGRSSHSGGTSRLFSKNYSTRNNTSTSFWGSDIAKPLEGAAWINHLFGRGSNVRPLSWDTRLKVRIGAARGLNFLHSLEKKIIYRDFKPSNILLDKFWFCTGIYSQVIGLCLAKLFKGDQTHVSTQIVGTYGYAAT
ncbi:Vesicle transport protein, Use1 [Sesbania bispinosa]|nr:Vesicle transport protein, Use1 [Sesbania bispinosa]